MYILISGGFDPLHRGHISAFLDASKLGKVVVAVNSDEWLIRKKGNYLIPRDERAYIIESNKFVHSVLDAWDDSDDSSCEAIKQFYSIFSGLKVPLLFANGGDRTPDNSNSLELQLCAGLGIYPIFNVGGSKTQSSSTFITDFLQRQYK
jgi:cytidyltransferase-like protein